jgi:hypothetical protein
MITAPQPAWREMVTVRGTTGREAWPDTAVWLLIKEKQLSMFAFIGRLRAWSTVSPDAAKLQGGKDDLIYANLKS